MVRASHATAVKVAAYARTNLALIAVVIPTVSVLMAAHTSEVLVWSVAYGLVGAGPAASNLLYFTFVNYTTLGYGDVVTIERWRLIGPMTAKSRVLLFGWSTAVIFEALRKAMDATNVDSPTRERSQMNGMASNVAAKSEGRYGKPMDLRTALDAGL